MALPESLAQAKEITEILGLDGKLLGHFTPVALANEILQFVTPICSIARR